MKCRKLKLNSLLTQSIQSPISHWSCRVLSRTRHRIRCCKRNNSWRRVPASGMQVQKAICNLLHRWCDSLWVPWLGKNPWLFVIWEWMKHCLWIWLCHFQNVVRSSISGYQSTGKAQTNPDQYASGSFEIYTTYHERSIELDAGQHSRVFWGPRLESFVKTRFAL